MLKSGWFGLGLVAPCAALLLACQGGSVAAPAPNGTADSVGTDVGGSDGATAEAASPETTGADAAGDTVTPPDLPDAGRAVETVGIDIADTGLSNWPETAGNLPPTVQWLAPATDALVQAGQAVPCTLTVADDKTALADLAVSVTLTQGGPALATDLTVSNQGQLSFALKYLKPGKVTVQVAVFDAMGESATASRTLLVNQAPGAPQVAILPAAPTTADALTAVLVAPAQDPESGSLLPSQHVWAWEVNGDLAVDLTGTTVPAERTKKGELWAVRVWASDGGAVGPAAEATVAIANAAPELAFVAIAPQLPTVADTLLCIGAPAFDADGEPVAASYQWTVDGVVLAVPATWSALPLAEVVDGVLQPAVAAKAGQTVVCTVSLSDGQVQSLPQSATATLLAFDTCAAGLAGCPPSSVCAMGAGVVATCTCATGFASEATACVDVDECAKGTATCPANAVCVNAEGSYECACASGWLPVGATCTDVDECATGAATCALAADCSNTAGGYTCVCKAGYFGDGAQCFDTDECAAGLGGDPTQTACDLAAACSNTAGSYVCACKPGFSGDGKSCTDIDECKLASAPCGLFADCTNTVGSFACKCQPGFAMDGTDCVDIDECASSKAACHAAATCKNSNGSFSCTCDAGYIGNGLDCADLDECKAGSATCSVNAQCKNLVASYACACKAGFVGNGKVCSDVDECAAGAFVCDANAQCKNADGSYLCTCAKGYIGDGLLCDDVDECALGTAGCHAAGVCANKPGGFTCSCKPGWTGDGMSCTPQ